jgi:cation-transporting ATPase 13A1
MGNKKGNVNVYRKGEWVEISSDKLLPGDIYELAKTEEETSVPCDGLLLNGSAVMNEASLTGESTPQMKEAISVDENNAHEALDMNNRHKVHVLYAGTTLLQHTDDKMSTDNDARSLKPPRRGVVCFALRTGFQSAQGKLVRMIEYSNEQVMSDTKETLILLGLLLVFALCSSGYVMYKGLQEQKRSQYELVLRCVLILTSVVPPELPMQTAVAVNTALMSLWRSQVFCTEPFRVPYAGRVDYCLFDKTGTLTSDQLETVGVVPCNWSPIRNEGGVELAEKDTTPLSLQIVIAGCHSVVEVNGKNVGDPVETAALHWVGWDLDAQANKAKPGQNAPRSTQDTSVKVVHRFHFSSKLQRMSTLARVSRGSGRPEVYVLTKGSPEALAERMPNAPHWYSKTYRAMSENGMRVLALAFKKLSSDTAERAERMATRGTGLSREEAESELEFAGFIAFSCRERKDSRQIIQNLKHGSHRVAMATGDNVLTALYISDEIGLTGQEGSKGPLVLEEGDNDGDLSWRPARDADKERMLERSYTPESIIKLDESGWNLCMTGSSFWRAVNRHPESWKHLERVKVFARMSPDNKEVLMRALKDMGRHTLMCGDGANDVGALKQAHVGVALLSGFASANTTRDGEKKPDQLSEEEKQVLQKEQAKKAREAKASEIEEQKQLQQELKRKQQEFYDEELNKLQQQGQEGSFMQLRATGKAMSRLMQYQKSRVTEIKRKHAGAGGQSGSIAQQAAAMAKDTENGEVPMVKLGDASVAAPFTSKLPSIRSTADIIRQGRCTLVSTIQQQQILALNCLIAAYSLSALYLDGVKSSEPQMIASGILLTVASLAFSYARSVNELSPVRPLRSIFHPAISLSIIGQLAIHLGCMVYSIRLARRYAPDEVDAMKESSYSQAGRKEDSNSQDDDPLMALFSGKSNFTPSLLNTVVFLVETAQQVSVMMVNYKGRPFMISSLENQPMLYSLALCCLGTFACAFELFPWLNQRLQLTSLPSDEFRTKLLLTLAASVFGSLLWDRLCVGIFAPKLLITGHRDAIKALPSWRKCARVVAFATYAFAFIVGFFASGNNITFLLAGVLTYRNLGVRRRINNLFEERR